MMNARKEKYLKRFLLFVGILLIPFLRSYAEDLRAITRLSGDWKFSIGDQKAWADPDYNDSDWDEIRVPESWEHEGYDDYNGYAWYRKRFKLSMHSNNMQLYLVLGRIDDCDEVFINGVMVGKSGSFPPYYSTAYGFNRKYAIPPGVLIPNGYNHIAVRVYDSHQRGGIVGGDVGIYADEDVEYLNRVLSGYWKFKIGNENDWRLQRINDDNWDEIHVPASWESQGYEDYDGYAWYRKDFKLPVSLSDEDLYISLGKIDDYDRVYINGEEIGEVYDLEKDGDYRRKGWEYNARRVYRIPDKLLNTNMSNTIAIRVYDKGGIGGIYEGPIGLMDEDNYEDYHRKHRDSRYFWDYFFELIWD